MSDLRYLCTNGHHYVSSDPDAVECDAPVHEDGVRPYVTTGSLDGVARCSGRLSRYESPDWPDEEDLARSARMREALRYMTQPTMGFPGPGPWDDLTPPAHPDPEWWVRNGWGTESNIRLALATCIGMAKAALSDPVSLEIGDKAE